MKRLSIIVHFIILFLLSLSFAYGEPVQIRILHVNDFHGFAEPYKPLGSKELLGGIAYLAGRTKELRKEKPSLLLSAGDMIQGNNWANLSHGESVIELMNEMGFDAMVLGNHEFDFGQDVLRERISEAKFPVLGANVEGLANLKPYIIKNLKGVRIGIIGVVTEDVPISTHPKNVVGLKFMSPIDTSEKYIAELKNRADLIIILSHIGYPADRNLAERVKGIDVIVGGHSHTKIEKPVKVGNTIIVQAWEHAKALGVLDLTVEDGKLTGFEGRLEEIKPEIGKEDKAASVIVEKYKQKVDAVLSEGVGEAEVNLDGENVRRMETNLGDLIADILRQASGADVTIINGGGIRTSIKKGEIRVKDVYSVLPFDNYIVAIKLTGEQIREALEHGVSAVEEGEGRFPQVSGLSFKYSLSYKRGSRVKEVLIAGQPIGSNREYIVATNDFLAAGGDGYTAFGEAIKTSKDFAIVGGMMKGEKVVYSNSGRWLRDVVVDYIKEMRKIAPKVEGRIIEAD
jgi:2',3'-cyclic-nucleotide 2'-phosphodiesterase (5'-nucleotidase family)